MEAQTEFLPPPEPLPVSKWVATLKFIIPGKPQPRGSKTPMVLYDRQRRPVMKDGRVIVRMIDDNPKSDAHLALCHRRGKLAMAGREPFECPVALFVRFYFARPKKHFGTGRNEYRLRDDAPECHTQKPDLDKCFRCLGDGLTGAVYVDDKLITATPGVRKFYGSPPRTEVVVYVRPDDHAAWLERNKF